MTEKNKMYVEFLPERESEPSDGIVLRARRADKDTVIVDIDCDDTYYSSTWLFKGTRKETEALLKFCKLQEKAAGRD